MLIEQIKFIETNPFSYQINSIYRGQNLQTNDIDRSATYDDVLNIINPMLAEYDAKRADDNFNFVKKQLEGNNVDLSLNLDQLSQMGLVRP